MLLFLIYFKMYVDSKWHICAQQLYLEIQTFQNEVV